MKYEVTSLVTFKKKIKVVKEVDSAEQAEEYAQIAIYEDLEDKIGIGEFEIVDIKSIVCPHKNE